MREEPTVKRELKIGPVRLRRRRAQALAFAAQRGDDTSFIGHRLRGSAVEGRPGLCDPPKVLVGSSNRP